ncbi:hypothetical protein SP15_181 [Bacillus phage SP-15]|uniref:Uncharacterized protein n=1 Tax=Bacillus phage SP-15 TaxID=1792032 RepID=A0A127AWB5_9CAUD|nr:hypothetical protein SP15_181 [Bacillus phage SP-15]AMM44979.1 hypothetical protein SP15_181 [Bacillus phage SP-15]
MGMKKTLKQLSHEIVDCMADINESSVSNESIVTRLGKISLKLDELVSSNTQQVPYITLWGNSREMSNLSRGESSYLSSQHIPGLNFQVSVPLSSIKMADEQFANTSATRYEVLPREEWD